MSIKEYCNINAPFAFLCMICSLELCHRVDAAQITNMGVLIPVTGMPFDGRKVVVAVPVAIEAAMKKFPGMQFNWSYADTKCDEALSVKSTLALHSSFNPGIDVIIGEVCCEACQTVGFVAAGLKVPFISTGCSSDKLTSLELYGTFARSVPPFKALIPVFNKLLDEFPWNRIGIVSTDELGFEMLSKAIKTSLSERNPPVSSYFITTERIPTNAKDSSFTGKEAMTVMKKNARIIFLIMSRRDVVHNLLQANKLNMFNGEYAFITCNYELMLVVQSEYAWENATAEEISAVQEGLMFVTFKYLDSPNKDFTQKINSARSDPHFQQDDAFRTLQIEDDEISALQYAAHMYDAVMMWANAKSQSDTSQTKPDAEKLSSIIRSTNFTGISGEIRFGANGEVIATEYDCWMIQNGKFIRIFQYDSSTQVVKRDVRLDELTWPGGKKEKPSGEPSCGWNDERCPDRTELYIIIGCCSFMGLFVVVGLLLCCIAGIKRYRRNKDIISNWRIQWTDIGQIESTVSSQQLTLLPPTPANENANRKISDGASNLSGVLGGMTQLFCPAGVYEKRVVAIKLIERDSVRLNDPDVHDELEQMLDMKHDNVNEFIGICLDAPHVCILMLYAHKGSLQDLINNESINISSELRMSIATDIVRGMEFLHQSEIFAHGHLTSSNCVVSQHWVCKITDYGMKLFKLSEKSDINSYQEALDLMWCSPELLRKELNDDDRFYGTKEGDVYSFSIIVSELVTVNAPYQQELINLTPSDIVYKVQRRSRPPFRPSWAKTSNKETEKWIELAELCWQEEPHKRPTFIVIKELLRIMNDGKRVNIMDWLYKTLEDTLDVKTNQLAEEREKTQRWMYSMFPKTLADALMVGTEVGPQMSDPVTVCFCGVLGMEKLVSTLTPSQIVEAVSGLYRLFDSVVNAYSVHKVGSDTSSEAMMFVSGLPERSLTHAVDMCTLALHLLSALFSSNVSYVQLQIGISTGPVLGVVIGKIMPRYRVYGKTVHQCLELQAASQARKIRINATTNKHLVGVDNHQFVTYSAGQIKTKDDEKLESFWVHDKIGFNLPLPE